MLDGRLCGIAGNGAAGLGGTGGEGRRGRAVGRGAERRQRRTARRAETAGGDGPHSGNGQRRQPVQGGAETVGAGRGGAAAAAHCTGRE